MTKYFPQKKRDSKPISLFWPTYSGREVRAALLKLFPADMSNRWLGQAHLVDAFEREFGKKFSYRYCISVSSGSAALELAYRLIGIGRGDEVITPVLTCTATNIPFLRTNANIIFADVKDDLTIDPMDVERKITKKTKAIIAVTLGGLSIDPTLFRIAKRRNIPVVTDAAQSLGIPERQGDYICYSFQAIKHFTTGDGGMLVVRDASMYRRAKKLRWFGIDREAKKRANWQPYQQRQMTMDIEEPGYKFQMNDIVAAIGRVGLRHSDEYLKKRRAIARIYDQGLDPGRYRTVAGGAYWLYGILTPNRELVVALAAKAGIETNMAHLRNDIFQVFGAKRWNLPNMNRLENQYLYIPIHIKMTLHDARRVVRVLNAI